MAQIAAHLGIVNQDEIENMSYDWFGDVLDAQGEALNFSAISNYAGNAFCEKSWDMILDNNPMLKGVLATAAERQLAAFFDNATPTVIKSTGKGTGGLNLFHGKIERMGNGISGSGDSDQEQPDV